MTEQEKINLETQRQLAMQDAKFNAFVEEMREFKNEMRQQNQMRAEEIREIRNDMKAAQEKHDADIKEIRNDMKDLRNEIHGTLKHIQNLTLASMGLTVAAVIGILAVAVGVLGFLWSTSRSMQPPPPAQPQSTYKSAQQVSLCIKLDEVEAIVVEKPACRQFYFRDNWQGHKS